PYLPVAHLVEHVRDVVVLVAPEHLGGHRLRHLRAVRGQIGGDDAHRDVAVGDHALQALSVADGNRPDAGVLHDLRRTLHDVARRHREHVARHDVARAGARVEAEQLAPEPARAALVVAFHADAVLDLAHADAVVGDVLDPVLVEALADRAGERRPALLHRDADVGDVDVVERTEPFADVLADPFVRALPVARAAVAGAALQARAVRRVLQFRRAEIFRFASVPEGPGARILFPAEAAARFVLRSCARLRRRWRESAPGTLHRMPREAAFIGEIVAVLFPPVRRVPRKIRRALAVAIGSAWHGMIPPRMKPGRPHGSAVDAGRQQGGNPA